MIMELKVGETSIGPEIIPGNIKIGQHKIANILPIPSHYSIFEHGNATNPKLTPTRIHSDRTNPIGINKTK
jgi:hypothetical protein